MVIDDVAKCDAFFVNKQNAMNLFQELYGKYSKTSVNFPVVENNPLYLKHNPNTVIDNIYAIFGFLTAYKNNNYEDFQIQIEKESINITSNIINENNINISFQNAKKQILDSESFSVEQTKEILAKISVMKSILNESKTKKEKWERLSPILEWLKPQGVLVVCKLIPIISDILK